LDSAKSLNLVAWRLDRCVGDVGFQAITAVVVEFPAIWGWVKTLSPCSSHQNSWDLWMFIPLKMVCIGIDP